MSISPTQDGVMSAIKSFLVDRLPSGVDVIQAVQNRVAEPASPNFAVLTLIRTNRLATNYDTPQDVRFTGSIAAMSADFTASITKASGSPGVMPTGIMTVTAVADGAIVPGALVGGAGVATGTYVLSQIDGSAGGIGNYAVSIAQDILAGALSTTYGLLTVTAVAFGQILPGASLFGVGLADGSMVRQLGSGTGGAGTYIVSPSQTFASGTLAAGGKLIRQNSVFTVQIDFHSGDSTTSSDMAQTVSAAFRDPYGVDFFAGLSAGAISPLYADDPRFAPFQNENQQFEYRWILEANLQVNQTTLVPAQFADSLGVTVIEVDAAYPP